MNIFCCKYNYFDQKFCAQLERVLWSSERATEREERRAVSG